MRRDVGQVDNWKRTTEIIVKNAYLTTSVLAVASALFLNLVVSRAAAETGVTNIVNGVTSNVAGNYYVGNSGPFNVLIATNAGKLIDTYGTIGNTAAASNNFALVTGTGSIWSNSNDLHVGDNGSGNRLTIANSGIVYNDQGFIGNQGGASNNAATVTGSGSLWSNRTFFSVGEDGSGNTLTITASGRVFNTSGYVGANVGAHSNAVTVTSPGSVWSNSSDLFVGSAGFGNTLTVTNGGIVSNLKGYIGAFGSASNNAVTVSGPRSAWNNRSSFYVGSTASGNALTIANSGAVAVAGNTYVGENAGANRNAITVTAPGSVWSNNNTLNVGYRGSGNTLTITNSGTVLNNQGFIGTFGSANSNAVTVTGSVWSNRADLYVGNMGSTNTLTIANSGTVFNAQGHIGAQSGANRNAVTVTGSGSVWINSSILVVGDGGSSNSLTIADGGTVSDAWGKVGYYGNNSKVTVTGSGSVWNNSGDLYVGEYSSGNTLTIADGGAVTVGGNAYIGYDAGADLNQLTLAGGSLAVTNAGGTGTLDVRRGTLSLSSGAIGADQYTQTAAGSLAIALTGLNSNVVLAVGGTAQLGGRLTVTNVNGFKPALSNAFTILTASTVSGAFAATNLSELDGAFDWSVNYLSTAVVLRVVDGTSPYAQWTRAHIPDPNQRATDQNADNDPHSNGQEYIADTDPTNPASYFSITAVSNLTPLTVYFISSSNRQYTLNWNTNWIAGASMNVPGQGPRIGAGGADRMQDTNATTVPGFYRLDVRLP
jgi:T5SS/PEP-CTERM-associated repeat protein